MITLVGLAAIACGPATAQDADSLKVDLRERMLTMASGRSVVAQIGRIQVPENRSKSGSRLIEVAFLRVKYAGEHPGTPNVLLAGGPGASGIELVERLVKAGGESALELMGGDLIGIDERGVGLSRPNLRSAVRYDLPLDRPADPALDLALMAERCREVAKGFRSQGIDLSGYNTAESADDIDAIREALGYDKLNVWGRSYGSHLALATLRRHERHVARVIACCPEGPDHTLKLPSQVEACLERLAKLVAADRKLRDAVPDLRALMKLVLDELKKQPVRIKVDHPLTGQKVEVAIGKFDVQLLTARALGDSRMMRTLPAAYVAMSRGDFAQVARLIVLNRSQRGVESAMKHMMDCSSGASPARLRRIVEEAEQCLLNDAMNFPNPGLSAAWGSPDLGDEFRLPIRSEVPVLFICGDLDPRTPVANAEELLGGLPRGQLVVVENAGHDLDLFGDPRLRDILSHFLRDRVLPRSRITLPTPRFTPPLP
jgi:pimeloyl-ACP methyl ester carboxylesterase